jgi:hypothetical protein
MVVVSPALTFTYVLSLEILAIGSVLAFGSLMYFNIRRARLEEVYGKSLTKSPGTILLNQDMMIALLNGLIQSYIHRISDYRLHIRCGSSCNHITDIYVF